MSLQLILTNSSILILGKLSPHFSQEHQTPCLPSGESPASSKFSVSSQDYEQVSQRVLKVNVKSDRTIHFCVSPTFQFQLCPVLQHRRQGCSPGPEGRGQGGRCQERWPHKHEKSNLTIWRANISDMVSVKFQNWEGGKPVGKKE